jgi:hypothetical protein
MHGADGTFYRGEVPKRPPSLCEELEILREAAHFSLTGFRSKRSDTTREGEERRPRRSPRRAPSCSLTRAQLSKFPILVLKRISLFRPQVFRLRFTFPAEYPIEAPEVM